MIKLVRYRQTKLLELLYEHGMIKTMPYELMLKVLDYIEVHTGFLNVRFLAAYTVRVDLPAPKSHPRWTHTGKAKSPMALRRMELGITQEQLAEMAHMSRTHLSKIENGFSNVTPELAQRLNGILGLPVI